MAIAGTIAFPQKMAQQILNQYSLEEDKAIAKVKEGFPNTQEYIVSIPIYLDDLPSNYNIEDLYQSAKARTGNNIIVKFVFYPNNISNKVGGFFIPSQPATIKINRWIDINNPIKTNMVDGFIEHELMHFVQYLISDSVGGPSDQHFLGYRSKDSLQEYKDLYPSLDKKERYHLLPEEFFPLLHLSKERFLSGKGQTKGTFKRFVGVSCEPTDKFFKSLKDNNPKAWARAVKELWKEVENIIYYK